MKGGIMKKKKIKNLKGNNQKKHTIRRLMERYGLEINDNEYEQLCNIIKKDKGEFVKKITLRVTVWDVMFKKKKIRLLYDKNRCTVITALTPSMEF
jgi:hypothetical protein